MRLFQAIVWGGASVWTSRRMVVSSHGRAGANTTASRGASRRQVTQSLPFFPVYFTDLTSARSSPAEPDAFQTEANAAARSTFLRHFRGGCEKAWEKLGPPR